MADLTLLINKFNTGANGNLNIAQSQSIDNLLHDDGLESSDSSIALDRNMLASAVELNAGAQIRKPRAESDLFNFSDIGDDSDPAYTQPIDQAAQPTLNFRASLLKQTKPVRLEDIFSATDATRQVVASDPTLVIPTQQPEVTYALEPRIQETARPAKRAKQGKEAKRQRKQHKHTETSDPESEDSLEARHDARRKKSDIRYQSQQSDAEQQDYIYDSQATVGYGMNQPTEQYAPQLEHSAFYEYVQLVDAKRQQRDVHIVTAGNVKRQINSKEQPILQVRQQRKEDKVNEIQVAKKGTNAKKQEEALLQSSVEIQYITKMYGRKSSKSAKFYPKGSEDKQTDARTPVLRSSQSKQYGRQNVVQMIQDSFYATESQNMDAEVPELEQPTVSEKKDEGSRLKNSEQASVFKESFQGVRDGVDGSQRKSSLSVPQPYTGSIGEVAQGEDLAINDLDDFDNSAHSETIQVTKPTRKPSKSLSGMNEPVAKLSLSGDDMRNFIRSQQSENAASATFSAQDTAMSQSLLQEYNNLYDSAPRKPLLSTQVVEQSMVEQRNPLLFYLRRYNLLDRLSGYELADYESKRVAFFEFSLEQDALPRGARGIIEPPVRSILGERVLRANGQITGLRVLVIQQRKNETMSRIGKLVARKPINQPEAVRAAESAGVHLYEMSYLNFGGKPHLAGIVSAPGTDLKMGILRANERFQKRVSRSRLVFLVIQGQIQVNGISVRAWESCYVDRGVEFSVVGESAQSAFWVFE